MRGLYRDTSRKRVLRMLGAWESVTWSSEEPFQASIVSMEMVDFTMLQNDAAPRNPHLDRANAVPGLPEQRRGLIRKEAADEPVV